jgi:hypothetical protein
LIIVDFNFVNLLIVLWIIPISFLSFSSFFYVFLLVIWSLINLWQFVAAKDILSLLTIQHDF